MLRSGSLLVVFVLAALISVMPANAAPREVTWDDLVPQIEPYDNPFEKMSWEQLDDLYAIYMHELAPEDRRDTSEAARTEAAEARVRLEKAGLDIGYLFIQREVVMEKQEEQATKVNPELAGETVRMPGFLLPIELDGRKAVEFLLVPTVGACIHTPPPDPNQVVHVVYPKGFEIDGLFTPVWITGRMLTETSKQNVGYRDGNAAVNVAYRLEAEKVVLYAE